MFGAEAGSRIGRATLDIVAPELIPDGVADRVRAALDGYEREGEG
jgi:hypothetical protein